MVEYANRKRGLLFTVMLVFSASVSADSLPDTDKDIIRLATILGGARYLEEMKEHYVESTFRGVPTFIEDNAKRVKEFFMLSQQQQKQILGSSSKRWQEKYSQLVNKRIRQDESMLTLYKPYLSNNYTAAEIQQLTVFYSSDLGKKTLQLHTEMIRESRYRFSEELVPVMTSIMEDLAKSELELLKLDIANAHSTR